MKGRKTTLTLVLLSSVLLYIGCTGPNSVDNKKSDVLDTKELVVEEKHPMEPDEYFETHPEIEEVYQEKMSSLTNTEAPNFKMVNASGETYNFNEFKGEDMLVAFVASWCGPCNEMIPVLSEFNENEGNPKVIMVTGFDTDEDFKDLSVVLESFGLDLYQANDFDSASYMLNSVPQFIYIDNKGDIKIISGGYLELETLELYAESSFD